MINLPVPAPLFHEGLIPFNAGSFTMSPIHIKDVANIFVSSIDKENDYGKTIELGGETELSWKEIIKIISNACGKKKWALPVPVIGVKTVAAVFDRYPDEISPFPHQGCQDHPGGVQYHAPNFPLAPPNARDQPQYQSDG